MTSRTASSSPDGIDVSATTSPRRCRAARRQPYMNPYLAGIGLGLVLLAAFVLVGPRARRVGRVQLDASRWLVNAVAPGARAGATSTCGGYLGDGGTHPLKAWLRLRGASASFAGALLSGLLAGRARDRRSRRARACRRAARLAVRVRGRRADGVRRRARARLHERPGAHRRRAAQRRQLGVHADGLRRRLRGRVVHAVAVAMIAPFYKYGLFGDETQPRRRLRHRHRLRLLPRAGRLRQRAQAGRRSST
ncbi:MAG: hypothetical protein MZV64_30755 [Ignavibacteriales bacterium]|nr:hypothetical protein [Ignavibacteriales bacterium]